MEAMRTTGPAARKGELARGRMTAMKVMGAVALLLPLLFAGNIQGAQLTEDQARIGNNPYRIGPVTVVLQPEREVAMLCQAPGPVRGCYRPETRTVVATPDAQAVLDGFQQYFAEAWDEPRRATETFVRTRLQREATVVEMSQTPEGWEVTVVAVEVNQQLGMVTERALYVVRLTAWAEVRGYTRLEVGQRLSVSHLAGTPRVVLLTGDAPSASLRLAGDAVYRMGPLTALLRPAREVESICGAAGLQAGERERILGCYLPHSSTLAAIPDPLVILHELKHYFEGNFHRADDALAALSRPVPESGAH